MMNGEGFFVPKGYLEPLKDYDTHEVFDFMNNIAPVMFNLFLNKDKDYGGSWQKRGALSVQSNFERKIDRVNAQFYGGKMFVEEVNQVENISDTLIDAANYQIMYLFFLYKKNAGVRKGVEDFIKKYKV